MTLEIVLDGTCRSCVRNEESLLSALAAPTTLQGVSEPLISAYFR